MTKTTKAKSHTVEKSKTYNFNSETGKVLKMMINSIYTNKDTFLRELVSNAIDAIEKRKCVSLNNEELASENGEYEIKIEIDKKNNTLTIIDNGIGMDKTDMIENLGTIAKSGTEEFFKKLKTEGNNNLIGQFGVGFYSSFITASLVELYSRKAGDKNVYLWSSEGSGSYDIEKKNIEFDVGTKIVLHIKPEETVYLDHFKVKNIVEVYSNNLSIPIKISYDDGEVENVKSSVAIWHKDKSSIQPEEYKDFYKSLSHLPDSPSRIIHFKLEGNLEFVSLLFIPTMKPFDLFHPDRQTRVKLYVKKVFITETSLDILPKYLRFVYGVIDSNDLPLNISRETLQNSLNLTKIQDITVKKILKDIKEFADENEEEYLKFWKNFGIVLKEGLCEGMSDKDTLLNISRFYTSKSIENPISLEKYIENKTEKDEKVIYYATGDTIDDAISNPQLEQFIDNDIEVVLLCDPVDCFWINVVNQYNQYEFKSISRSDVSVKNNDKDDEQEESDINQNELLEAFKEALKDKVKDVTISKKLTSSLACLSHTAGSMDIKMERFLVEQKQLNKTSLKILEINPSNAIIQSAFKDLTNKDEEVQSKGKELALTIFEMACIAQGETIDNNAAFVKRLSKIIKLGLNG